MAEEAPQDPAAEGVVEEVEKIPEVLSLSLFYANEKLSDCTVKLPEVAAGEGEGEAAPPAAAVRSVFCFFDLSMLRVRVISI